MPFFSVIIPVYNRIGRIDGAVNSMLSQTFIDWELIIVDDGSTDGTWEHIQTYEDKRIHVIHNAVNSERCVTRNNGILHSSGLYICFLDSDDHHLPEHLEKLHRFINQEGRPEAFFFTDAWNEDEDGNRTERHCPTFVNHDPFTYFLRYTVNPQRWAVHRNVMRKHLFDPEVNICEDMDTSLRMVADGVRIFQLRERTTCYVAASDSFTHGASNKWERELMNLERIFKKPHLVGKLKRKETNILKSMCHFHIGQKALLEANRTKTIWHGLLSFILCPEGYNKKTNKSLVFSITYSLPVIGYVMSLRLKYLKKQGLD